MPTNKLNYIDQPLTLQEKWVNVDENDEDEFAEEETKGEWTKVV